MLFWYFSFDIRKTRKISINQFLLIFLFPGKTKRRDSKKKSESGDGLHREQNLLSGGRILDNQAKWRKLNYKGDPSQSVKKTDALLSGNDFGAVKKVGEIRRTSDSDINRSAIEKNNTLNAIASRLTEVNGIKKDLISQEKRRRLSLMDEKDLHLGGKHRIRKFVVC